MNNKKLVVLILFIISLSFLANLFYVLFYDSFETIGIHVGNRSEISISSTTEQKHARARFNSTHKPKILFWTLFWGDRNLVWGDFKAGFGDEVYQKMNCTFKCENIIEKSQWNISDAIMIHPIDPYWPLPPGRFRHQKWVFYMQESPILGAVNDARLDDVFNWTMTYHRSSDIQIPYGRFLRRKTSIPMRPLPTQRQKIAAWMVGHCNTHNHRELLFDKLSKYITMTKYGRCNGNPCNEGRVQCMQNFRLEHYFYLAWENSLCDDYITEKLWNALAVGIVPVVYGGADYKQFLPPNSFIDIFDFGSLAELANYLTYLSQNITAYEEYLRWTEDYTINLDIELSWCDLCEKLHLETEQPTFTTVKGVEFWAVKKHCTRREANNIFRN